MTTPLPTTFADAVETAALAFAREWIEQQRAPGGAFHPDAEQTYGHRTMKAFAESHVFAIDEIAYLAEQGSATAWDVLDELLAERLERCEEPGAPLRHFNTRRRNRAAPKPGPRKVDNFVRDLAITLLIAELRDQFGLKPTRSPGGHGPSGTSVASTALVEARIGAMLAPRGVEKIWRRFAPVFAGTRATAGSRFALGWPANYPGLFG